MTLANLNATNNKIVVAEDEKDILQLIVYVLKKAGYQVLPATNGLEALRLIQQHNPCLVLLDIMMPKMDGLEVCRHLRANPATAALPVLILSAKVPNHDEVAWTMGAKEYIFKPFIPQDLVSRVRRYAEEAQLAVQPSLG